MKQKAFIFFLVIFFAACSGTGSPKQNYPETWARPAAIGSVSAAYTRLENTKPVADTLIQLYAPEAFLIEIHESFEENGLAGMRKIKQLVLQPHSSEILAPGGKHFMLIELTRNLIPGDTVQLTLSYSSGNEVVMNIPVLSEPR